VKLLPIWCGAMVYAAVTSQVYTLFTKQGSTLDRRLGTGLVVPPAALQCLISFTFITMLPVYDRAHLDYFYWLLAGLAALDVAIFLYFSKRFVYRNKGEL
jgi:hypothetical protein